MLSQVDFVGMIGDMQAHVEKTIGITDELISELDDKELRFKLIALRQSKRLHLEAMSALAALVKEEMNKSGVKATE